MIRPSQRPLPDKTQRSQQTNIHAPGGIRTHDRSRRAAVDLRLRPRGYWDRHHTHLSPRNFLIGVQAFLKLTCLMRLFGVVAGWQPLQWIQQIFRERWSRNYLNNLQQRSKRAFIQLNLHPGTVVRGQGQQPPILEQENSSGAGYIYIYGRDDLVRVATAGSNRRPIHRLLILPTGS